jgi:hypothetical protein
MKDDILFMVQVDLDAPSIEDEFNAWYNDEHVPELLRVPGFLSGRRFRATNGQPKYAALYELESIAALSEPLFHQARPAHPKSTTATKKMWPHVRNLRRGIYARLGTSTGASSGERTESAHLLLIGLKLDANAEAAFRDWCCNEHLPRLARAAGLGRAVGYVLDPRSTDHQNPPGQGLLLYELLGEPNGQQSSWPGDYPAPVATRILFERIYPA